MIPDLAALRAACLAATPESVLTRCDYDHGGGRVYVDREGDRFLVMDLYHENDRAYYAAANPQAVLALIDMLDALERIAEAAYAYLRDETEFNQARLAKAIVDKLLLTSKATGVKS